MGTKFGFAAAVLKSNKYINLHNAATSNIPDTEELDEAWEFEYPIHPQPYDDTALSGGATAGEREQQRRKQEAIRNEQIVQFDVF